MPTELIILLLMLFVFAAAVFYLKLPSGIALALSAIIGALAGGEGIPIRHLLEGSVAFIDPIIIVITAMVFMKVSEATGALASLNYSIINSLHNYPTLLIILIMFFVMLPGMLTGISTTCILTTGALVAPALIAMGMPKQATGSLIAMGAVYGMIAPPINLPIMIIGGGVDMPYVGFELPLLLLTFPLAILTAVYYRMKYVKKFDPNEVTSKLPASLYHKYGIRIYLPILIVVFLMILIRILPMVIPDVGIPVIFIIGIAASYFAGEKFRIIELAEKSIKDALPVLGILVGVGMFVQIMTLTGVRGYIAVSAIELPPAYLYLGIALIMPAFGSAFASSSVLGVPLIFVFLGSNEILIASALSLIAGLGDLMPPPSLLPVFAAQLVGEKNHFNILKYSVLPIIVSLAAALLLIYFAKNISSILSM